MSVPITNGTGASSVAAESVGGLQYQRIEMVGNGGSSILAVNGDGSINASIVGRPSISGAVGLVGTPSISGAVTVVGNVNVSGSVAAFQSGTQITSLVSTVPSSVIVGASIFGALPAGDAILGAVAASISGTVTVSVLGTVPTTQAGTVITSLVSTIPSSVIVGTSIFGQLPAGTAPIGSVATLQGTNPWVVINTGSVITTQVGSVITVPQSSSVLAVPVGSVITVLQSPSVVGTYAEDAAHTSGEKGIFVMQVRNDTLSSITSADGDYSPVAGGPVGETITANAPITKWVRGTADLRVVLGASVTAIAAQGASVFTYITGVQVANMGSASVLVTLAGGLGSILGYTIAPAGGGSNILYPNALKTGENSAFTASISGTASVLVSAQGFIAKI